MKILFCTTDTEGRIATGPNAWLQRLVPDLIHKYNLDIEVLVGYYGDMSLCPTINFFNEAAIKVHTINKNKVVFIEDETKRLLQIIKKEGINILVANLIVPGLYAARILHKYNIPSIAVIHSNDSFYKGVIAKFVEAKRKSHITHFVCVSDYLTALLKKNNPYHIPTTAIPCGTPLISDNLSFSKFNPNLKIIYAGRIIEEQKQIFRVADAFMRASSANSNFSFSLYGSGPDESKLVQILNQSKQNHNVTFHGSVPPAIIQDKMKVHQVFTLMSDYEGMPVALMEAMACGLVPVCLEELSGINEIIEDGVNGFIVKDCIQEYQDKLKLLSENPEVWQKLSSNAQQTVIKKYSSDITHKKWQLLLNSLNHENVPQNIVIPKRIKCKGPTLPYGDKRKPHTIILFKRDIKKFWLEFRLLVRPRARIRSIFNK